MGKFLQNPYGTSSFETIIRQNKAFVDKTMFIKSLDELASDYPILLRPLGFGKSTFVSMLKYFYDQSFLDKYDQIFSKTKIYKEDLKSHNTYHVLLIDFSGIATHTQSAFYKGFSQRLINSITNFKVRYPTFVCSLEKEVDFSPTDILGNFFISYQEWYSKNPQEFLNSRTEETDLQNLYIIIDEYDNFANEILNTDRDFFKKITSESGLLKEFYKLIKSETDVTVAKTFITGVSSISLDSITSGFNIAKNITTLPMFNEYAGMTEEDLREIIKELVDYESFNIDLDQMVDGMRQVYNGYAFTEFANHKLFNTSMCLNYIDQIIAKEKLIDPNKFFDPACNFDPKRLYDLLNHTKPEQLNKIIQAYYEDQTFEKMATAIPLALDGGPRLPKLRICNKIIQ